MIQDAIRTLAEGSPLSPVAAAAALTQVMAGEATPAQIGAFLAALRIRGETPEMVAACIDVMLANAEPVPVANTIDICGTGGDAADTFNVSTAAGIVAAAAGARVAKHGNRAASSKCGSADLLEAAGANLQLGGAASAKVLEACGFVFLFAQRYHPAMRHVGPARREMGIRTIFNVLGPLSNPARPERQLAGVGAAALAPIVAGAFAVRKYARSMVVHSEEGLDEISPAGPTRAWVVENGHTTEMPLTPDAFGVPAHPLAAVAGGDAEANLATLNALLAGEKGAVRDYVLANAGAALWVAGIAENFRDGAGRAAAAIDSGRARTVLDAYVRLSKDLADG